MCVCVYIFANVTRSNDTLVLHIDSPLVGKRKMDKKELGNSSRSKQNRVMTINTNLICGSMIGASYNFDNIFGFFSSFFLSALYWILLCP